MRRLLTSLASIVIVTLTLQAAAQDFPAQVVSAVRCEGLTRVSEQLIRAQLEVKSGQPYNSRAVSRDIRRLYDLDYFANIIADVQTVAGQVILTYIFEEKRFIDEVKIIGNKKVRTRDIRGAVSWRTGDAFLEDGYEQERDAVLNLYKQKGYPNTTVDIIVDEVAPGRVRVTYNIDEGKKARIKRISFEGNEVLSKRKLNKLMKTGRAWWFVGGKYDEAKFEADLQNILKEYGNFGRLEADVVKVDLIYPDNARRLLITISLAEGPEYAVEQLDIANNEVFDDDEIMRIVKVHPGDVHNTGQLEKDTDLIRKGYEDSGYINANVTPQVTVDPENKKTQVLYAVEEGDLKYVREIKITGNNVTKDEVIRRDLLLVPGERFDGTALQASQRRLENSQYFQEVRFTREPTDDERFANLLLDVDEGKTGNFNFGVGYSTEERLGGFAELRLDNFDLGNWPSFSGGGQQFRTRISLGDVRSQYSLSFTDPEFLGYPLAFGFDVFDEYYEYTGGVEFDERTQGAQLRFGKLLSPYVNARTSLRYDNVDISHLPYFASRSLRRERGGSSTISTIWGITRNTLDYYRDPSSGSKHDFELQLAGLGGDNHFYKLQQDSTWFVPFGEERKWILSVRGRAGWVNDYGSSDFVPISDRFFVGGASTVRGYDTRDIGPKEPRYLLLPWGPKDAVGGELRLVGNVEMKYKVLEQFRLYTFFDSGGVWREAGDFDLGDMKHSVGIGLGVEVPRLGPVRVDYGIPLNADYDQGSGRLHLLTGLRF